MKSSVYLLMNIALFSILLQSCQQDDTLTPVSNNYLKVKDALTSGSLFKVEMFANDSFFVGYNKVYFKVTKMADGTLANQATLVLHPLMDMVTFTHACPVENPSNTSNADNFYEGAILFSMPGTNTWSVAVDVTSGGTTETANFNLTNVVATSPVRKIVAIDSLSNGSGGWIITKYPLSLVIPKTWKVGNNPLEITAHRMADMMNFPPATDLTFEITPEMPSMGHGSPNNVNPVHMANGHYVGSVNFTMTGDWRIHLTIKKGDRLVTNKLYFDLLF